MGVSRTGVPGSRFAASCCTLLHYPESAWKSHAPLDAAPECRVDADEWHRVLRPPRGVVGRPIRSVLIGGWSLSGGSDCSGCRRRVSDARRRAMLPALVSAAPAAVFHAARLAGVSIKTMKS